MRPDFRETSRFYAVREAFLCFSILLSCLLAGTLPGEANQFKRIRDISVRCTNTLICDISTDNAQSELYAVTFRRRASADAQVELVLGVRETLGSRSEIQFEIDGREVLRLPVSQLSYRAAVYEYTYRNQEEISVLVAAAKAGRVMRVSFRARSQDTVSVFSLSGFIGGLIFMDEMQGRVGRPDALQASGDGKTENGVPMRDFLSFSDIPFRLRSQFTGGDTTACGGLDEQRFANLGGFEANSGGDTWLMALPCGEGGAYNQPYAFWERNGSQFRRVPVPVMTGEGPSTSGEAWNISWDQERQELTGFFKGRGLGDCGVLNRWAWKELTEGHVFILVESRAKSDCDGDPAGGPENWPSVWPPA